LEKFDWRPEEVAWAAAAIEMCGSFRLGSSGRRSIKVTCRYQDYAARRLSKLGIGNVYGPYRVKGLKGIIWQWQVNRGTHIRALCEAIYPWMSPVRQKQIGELLQALGAAVCSSPASAWCCPRSRSEARS
jgi:hypothetical protein